MSAEGGLQAFFTDPTYDVPLVIAAALIVGLSWWSLVRTKPLGSATLRPGSDGLAQWSAPLAFASLQQGHYFPTLYGLWQRLATTVLDRFGVRIESGHVPDSPVLYRVLPDPLTLRRVVRDVTRAYYSAFWAERPSWLALQWPWLKRRQQRRAAADFARAVADLARALKALEAS
jgi:hypothetical protein